MCTVSNFQSRKTKYALDLPCITVDLMLMDFFSLDLGIHRADSGGAGVGPIGKLSQRIPDSIPQSVE